MSYAFQSPAGPFTLAALARIADAEIAEGGDGDREIRDVAALDRAGAGDLTFLDNRNYRAQLRTTAAGAAIVAADEAGNVPEGTVALIAAEPYRAFALVAQAFYPDVVGEAGVHESAVIAADAALGEGCRIGARVVIGAGARLGNGVSVGAGTVIGDGVEIGEDCRIGDQVSLSHCLIGPRTVIHPGVRVGQDGFGFAPSASGHVKVPQIGRALIGADCDIGANTTIDRGSMQDTVIGDNCWIDNLVQIAHNVQMGRGCVIAAMTGISGSTRLGDFVTMGGQVGMAGHLNIGSGARIAAKSGVMSDVGAGETVCGAPAMPIKEFFRQVATLKRLASKKG